MVFLSFATKFLRIQSFYHVERKDSIPVLKENRSTITPLNTLLLFQIKRKQMTV